MELRQVRYFAAVARHRHFTRAAEDLGLAQPALSQQVRNLERELGVELLDRSGRRVRLTDAGAAFLVWAERILADVAAAESEMAEFAGLRRGRVVVGATPVHAVGRVDLPGLLAAFHARHPGIEVALREATTDDLVGDLALGRIDVAIGALIGGAIPDGIAAHPLYAEDLVVMAAPKHPLAGRTSASVADLAADLLVLSTPGSPTRRAVSEAAGAAGVPLRIAFEASEPALVRSIAARGLALAVVPRSLAEEPGEPVAILPLDGLPGRTVALLWAADRPRPAASRAFLAFARDRVDRPAPAAAAKTAIPPDP